MSRDTWRRLVTRIVVAVVPAATMLMAGAAPAQAYSCSVTQWTTLYQPQGVAHADLAFSSSCNDGQMHWSGRVYDDKCDGRAGEVGLIMDQFIALDGSVDFAWQHDYTTSNGCGTSATFSGSDRDPGGSWTLSFVVIACSGWFNTNCSNASVEYLYP